VSTARESRGEGGGVFPLPPLTMHGISPLALESGAQLEQREVPTTSNAEQW